VPDTSVPPPVSLGATVNSPRYHEVGRVAVEAVSSHVRTVVSNVLVRDMMFTSLGLSLYSMNLTAAQT